MAFSAARGSRSFFAVHEPPQEFDKLKFKRDIDNHLEKFKSSWSYPAEERYLSWLKGLLDNDRVSEGELLVEIRNGIGFFSVTPITPENTEISLLLTSYKSQLERWTKSQTEMVVFQKGLDSGDDSIPETIEFLSNST